MSTPHDNHQFVAHADDHLLDRLIDCELSEPERRALLLRLEAEQDGWRRCALAFLELQTWRQALAPLAKPSPTVTRPEAIAPQARRRRLARRYGVRAAGLAASLAAAFALGWAMHSGPAHNPQAGETAAVEPPAPLASGPPSSVPAESAVQSATPSAQPAELGVVLRKLEQRGYRAETQKRLISMPTKDGRKLDVPVQEIRLRYIGGRTY
jgi:hypothetical protein